MEKAVVLFFSTNYAMWANDILSDHNIDNKLISVPRHLSSDCGYCIQIDQNKIKTVQEILQNNDIEFDKIESI